MVRLENDVVYHYPETSETNEVIRQLRQAITGGRPWYSALLRAMGQWDTAEETVNGRVFRYTISGEAFDWLLLAERLCEAVSHLLPDTEKNALLFNSEPPLVISEEEFRQSIGDVKYHQYLNFFYGITVEEALIYAVEEEIRKERRSSGLYRDRDNTPEAFRRIYGSSKAVMLRQFRNEKKYPQLKSIKLDELKEFTYWLFKHRLKQSDKARVASDTKKGLDWLRNNRASRKSTIPRVYADTIDTL